MCLAAMLLTLAFINNGINFGTFPSSLLFLSYVDEISGYRIDESNNTNIFKVLETYYHIDFINFRFFWQC